MSILFHILFYALTCKYKDCYTILYSYYTEWQERQGRKICAILLDAIFEQYLKICENY